MGSGWCVWSWMRGGCDGVVATDKGIDDVPEDKALPNLQGAIVAFPGYVIYFVAGQRQVQLRRASI